MGQQRVIPSRAGVAVVARSLLGQSIGLADGRVQVDGQGRVAGSRPPAAPCPGQQLAAHAVELTDMPPAKAAQEGAQGGWRLDHAAENTDRPTGAQRIGVVDAVAASQGGGDQRQHLAGRALSHPYSRRIGCSLFPGGFLFQNHYPRFRGAPSAFFKGCPQGRPSVDSGLNAMLPVKSFRLCRTLSKCPTARFDIYTSIPDDRSPSPPPRRVRSPPSVQSPDFASASHVAG